MKKLVAGALAAAALMVLAPAPAQANWFRYTQPIPVDPGIGGSADGLVRLVVERDGEPVADAMLLCPEGAGHPEGVEACAQLTIAEGDFHALPVADGMCTKEYDPVVFKAFGFWDGALVAFEEEYGNRCTGVNATGGAVFDLGEH